MQRLLMYGCFASLLVASCAFAKTSPETAANELSEALKQARHVSVYFVLRTEVYSYDAAQMRSESSTRIYRACGGNCRNFMREMVAHLRASHTIDCPRKQQQQDMLIEVGEAEEVMYSYSGRAINYRGTCYFNESSLSSEFRDSGFPFHAPKKPSPAP